MRVGYYYGTAGRLPAAASNNNPYGTLLAEALERRGLEVEFVRDWDEEFLRRNRGRIQVLHHNWPHYEYYHDDAATMRERMRHFVRCLDLARELDYKVVWTAHNLYPHNRRHQAIDHDFRLEICRLADAIIAHCDVAAQSVRETFGHRHNLFVIPHGHFIGVYPEDVTRERARVELGVPAGAFAYGFFASIQRYKGVEELIASFKRLPGENAWLLISGGGAADYLAQVHALAGGHPRIVLRTYDRAPSSDIGLIMRAADVVTLPFLATTTSGSLILALSWARPVIAPALGCLPTTVDPGAGILYDAERPEALHEALREIQGWDMVAASRAAFACAERLDWDRIAELTVEAYRA